ncbi:MAG: DUF2125 domain-containing protein [Paracoccus sp. (in: a-proteobacteria)]|nr:DUF2125 domain-containing protein [Paracoccus sp. (in: a-proteobacteria)]
MRGLLITVLVVALLAVGGWMGGESWLSNRAREQIAASPDIDAASVAPLRAPGRFGLHLTGVEMGDGTDGISAPALDLFVPVTRPNAFSFDLPPEMVIRQAGLDLPVSIGAGTGFAALSPANRGALSEAQLDAQSVALAGAPLLESLSAHARLAVPGLQAPIRSNAAYDVTLDMQGLAPEALTGIGLPSALDATGAARVWLTEAPGAGSASTPRLTGIETQGVTLTLGPATARLMGRVIADAEGRAEGQLGLYSTDAQSFLEAAAAMGLMPQSMVLPVVAGLNNLASFGAAEDSLPPAAPGEMRIALRFEDGQTQIGPVTLGPAPVLLAD